MLWYFHVCVCVFLHWAEIFYQCYGQHFVSMLSSLPDVKFRISHLGDMLFVIQKILLRVLFPVCPETIHSFTHPVINHQIFVATALQLYNLYKAISLWLSCVLCENVLLSNNHCNLVIFKYFNNCKYSFVIDNHLHKLQDTIFSHCTRSYSWCKE